MDVVDRLIYLRRYMNLSYRKTSEKIGFSSSYIHAIENRKRPVTQAFKKKIVNQLYVSEIWLEQGTGDIFDEKRIGRRKIYDATMKIIRKLRGVYDELIETAVFKKEPSEKAAPLFFDIFPDLNESCLIQAEIQPIDLTNALCDYYDSLLRGIDVILRMIDLLEQFDEAMPELASIRKIFDKYSLCFTMNKKAFTYSDNYEMFDFEGYFVTFARRIHYKEQLKIREMISKVIKKQQ